MDYPGDLIQRGDEGDAVRAVQRALAVQETGIFGPTTEACVKEFQERQGLEADGVVGPKTWAALFAKPAGQSIRAVALSIARRYVGTQEEPRGSNRGRLVDLWNAHAGVPVGSYWCMSFVYAMFREAAAKLGAENPLPRTASCSALYAWAKRNGKLVKDPQAGDILLVRGGPSGHQHTGIVAGPPVAGYMPTVEGNSNDDGSRNGVEVAFRPRRRVSGCDFVRV